MPKSSQPDNTKQTNKPCDGTSNLRNNTLFQRMPKLRVIPEQARKLFTVGARINYRHITAALLCFILLLTTGAFNAIGAVTVSSANERDELFPGYTIYLDEVELGTIKDLDSLQAELHGIQQELQALYKMKVSLGSDYRIRKVYLAEQQYAELEEITAILRRKGDFKVEAAVLVVDGETVGYLKAEKEIEGLLDRIKAPYVNEDTDGLVETAAFMEEIVIDTQLVSFYEVQDAADMQRRLTESTLHEETYTVVEGDTLWTISRQYSLDMDNLKALNTGLTDSIRPGQEIKITAPRGILNVETVEIIHYTEDIAFQTETRKDSTMFKNQTKVLQQGKKGLESIEARVSKINGLEQDREIISREVLEEPVVKIVAEGTKAAVAAVSSRSGGTLRWPTAGRVSSPYGMRWGRMHTGIDIANSSGTPVYAAESGRVSFSSYSGGYGNLIQIDHGGGVVTYYAHLRSRSVQKGNQVSRGQLIGYMGSTGNSTGPHLHFEVRINGNPTDPMRYLR